jgi:hypothetical protein
MLQEIYERLPGREETPTIAISSASSKIWRNICKKASECAFHHARMKCSAATQPAPSFLAIFAELTVAAFPRELAASRSGIIPPFVWTTGSEPSHAAEYKLYLEDRIGDRFVDSDDGYNSHSFAVLRFRLEVCDPAFCIFNPSAACH